MPATDLYQCQHCGAWVNPDFGKDEPAKHLDASGTKEDPRAPGDHTRCCDQCCYGHQHCTESRR